MERIEDLKHVKQELDREEKAVLSFSKNIFRKTLTPKDRYVIGKLISEGGFKKVYLAHDTKTARDIAYAKIDSDEEDLLTKNRVIREARITAMLDHSNITPLYDVGQDEDGIFFTMKLMSGEKMSSLIQGDITNPKQHFSKMLQHVIKVCEALSYAHSKGILHLDIKASNIHIGKYGETYLFDWGLSKLIQASDDEILNLEIQMDDQIRGTPGLMSPEQLKGDEDNYRESTDIFLLGTLIYSIYTRKRLGDEQDISKATSYHYQELDFTHHKIPNTILGIIKKATQAEQKLRYQKVDELIFDLQKYLEHLPTSVDRHQLLKTCFAKVYHHPYASFGSILFLIALLVLNNYLTQLELQHANNISSEQEKTIKKILPFTEMPARHILDFYDHPKAEQIANTLIESKPDTSQAWALKGLLEASQFDFKQANQTFDHLFDANLNISSQKTSLFRFAEKLKNVIDDEVKDPYDIETILHYIDQLGDPKFVALLSKKFYEKHFTNRELCLEFFDRALKIMNSKKSIQTKYLNTESGLKIILHAENEKLNASSFLSMPYHSLVLSGFSHLYMPPMKSPSLKELDLSSSKVDNIYFLPDLNLEKLNISNLHINDIFYEGMKNLKVLWMDHITFGKLFKPSNILGSCRNIERLSAIGVDNKSIISSLPVLKKLKFLRCNQEQKHDIIDKVKDIHFEFIPESQAL